jgi:hypothetical protein
MCLPPRLGLARHPPLHLGHGAQERRSAERPPPPPRPEHATPERPRSAVHLRERPSPLQRRPRHAMPVLSRTDHAAPRYPERDLRRVVQRTGIASALEPPLRRLLGLADGAGIAADGFFLRPRASGGILTALPRGITISKLSVIHPLSINTLPRSQPGRQPLTGTSKRGRHTQEWSPTATALSRSSWRPTGGSASQR